MMGDVIITQRSCMSRNRNEFTKFKQAHAVPQTETSSIEHDQERDINVVAVLELA